MQYVRLGSWLSLGLILPGMIACEGGSIPPEVPLVEVFGEASQEACAHGGVVLVAGVDRNGDGRLEDGEIEHTYSICNGADGIDGLDGAVADLLAGEGILVSEDGTLSLHRDIVEAWADERVSALDLHERLLALVGGAENCPNKSVLSFDANGWHCHVAEALSYDELVDTPDLSVFAEHSELHGVAFSGNYASLENLPDLSVYATSAALSPVAFSGEYSSLLNTPDLSVFALSSNLSTVATSGSYSDLSGRPVLSAVAASGSYDDLSDQPDLSVYAEKTELEWVAGQGFIYAAGIGAPSFQLNLDFAQTSVSATNPWPTDEWQSFFAYSDGELRRVQYQVNNGPAHTFRLYRGSGVGGELLFTASITAQNGIVTVDLPPGIQVQSGQMLTWRLTASSGLNLIVGNRIEGTSTGGMASQWGYWMRSYQGEETVPALTIHDDGSVGVRTGTPLAALDVNSDSIRIQQPHSPASNSSCATGEISWDENYVYVCVALNRWRRAALAAY